MIPIFTGWDQREMAGWSAFANSVVERSSGLVQLIPLCMDAQKDGSNAFTYSRFLVPEFMVWAGWAIFLDGVDMICMEDIYELWKLRDPRYAVQVVKHDYHTKHARKYVGTEMEAPNEDYPRKNWSSVILWNCTHKAHFDARAALREEGGAFLHRFSWLRDEEIGELPVEWNWLADEYGANTNAKIVHFTAGIPGIKHYARSPHAQAWFMHSARSQEVPAERRIAEIASAR